MNHWTEVCYLHPGRLILTVSCPDCGAECRSESRAAGLYPVWSRSFCPQCCQFFPVEIERKPVSQWKQLADSAAYGVYDAESKRGTRKGGGKTGKKRRDKVKKTELPDGFHVENLTISEIAGKDKNKQSDLWKFLRWVEKT